MKCQVCGTVDMKHLKGPVLVEKSTGEGLCTSCYNWLWLIEWKAGKK